MKTFASLFTSLVLTAAMLTGCGCTNRNGGMTAPSTMLPTTEETTMTTSRPTEMTTEPTGVTGTDETVNHGNGPLVEESTASTDVSGETTLPGANGRSMPIK